MLEVLSRFRLVHATVAPGYAQGPTVDEVEFEVFKTLLNSMLDEVLSVQEEPASLEGVVLTNCHTGAWS